MTFVDLPFYVQQALKLWECCYCGPDTICLTIKHFLDFISLKSHRVFSAEREKQAIIDHEEAMVMFEKLLQEIKN
jgi:hypothetical protein